MAELTYFTAEKWKELYSEYTHQIVFNHQRPKEIDRTDYALVVGTAEAPESFMTCVELDARFVYMQYGGSFPGTKGSIKSLRNMQMFIDWHFAPEQDVHFLSFVTENENIPMIKLGLKTGFKIIGTRTINGTIMLEFMLTKSEYDKKKEGVH